MFVPKEILHNWLIKVPLVQTIAKRSGSAGLDSDPEKIREVYEFYTSHVTVKDKSILELGPGRTLELLERALQDGARSCSAVDVQRYLSEERIESSRIEYRLYDGKYLPYSDASFDILWASTVLEHVRYPQITTSEIYRTLVPGGVLISTVDLRDHYHLDDKTLWLECLRYSERLWNAMTWNRSAYVNRLRFSEWVQLLEDTGFEKVSIQPQNDPALWVTYGSTPPFEGYSQEDIVTFAFNAVFRKPFVVPQRKLDTDGDLAKECP